MPRPNPAQPERSSAEALRNMPAALERAARERPRNGFRIYNRRGSATEDRNYPEMLQSVRAAAARLKAAGVGPGDRVPVCLPTGWPFVEAWLGAVWLGALPVAMAYQGAMSSAEAQVGKLDAVCERLGARRLVCDMPLKDELAKFGARHAGPVALAFEDFAALPGGEPPAYDAAPEELAFLQLTSGSTGLPRAVMIPHRAVLHNPVAIADAVVAPFGCALRDHIDGVASWLPLNHDMGLIGCLAFCIVHGVDLWLMRSETFLARPKVWLQALGSGARVLSPSPNFAFQTCIERLSPADLEGLDLRNWKGAMTGAEMVRPETCAAFGERFSPVGFDPRVFRPCYGLAEGTLAVTFDRTCAGVKVAKVPGGGALDLRESVSNGPAVLDTQVVITAPDGTVLGENAIGEVRAKGPAIFAGYYRDGEATSECLKDGWLRTGDLGFLKDGELYLTGRTKEILIIHGHNLMPQEIEWHADAAAGGGGKLRSGAFSVPKGSEGEQAVVVLEIDEREGEALAALAHDIRSRVGRALSLPLADLVFVKRGQIPKTTSGKVQRLELRRRYLDGKLERL